MVTLTRHVRAFFQGNRFLIGALAAHVVEQVPAGDTVVDLYAGAGLFAIAAAAARDAAVIAVEGDALAADDLRQNAGALTRVRAVHQSVEAFVGTAGDRPGTVIVDPPR